MKTLVLLTIQLSLLVATPCLAQQQLVFPANPQLGGFPPGHPGIPIVLDSSRDKANNSVELNMGDMVLLDMRDRPAAAFLKLTGNDVPPSGAAILLDARVIKIEAGKVVVEFQTTAYRETDSAKIITVTSSLGLQQVSGPPKYREYVSPNVAESDKSKKELKRRLATLPRVRIETFDQTKIRIWNLATEITE